MDKSQRPIDKTHLWIRAKGPLINSYGYVSRLIYGSDPFMDQSQRSIDKTRLLMRAKGPLINSYG